MPLIHWFPRLLGTLIARPSVLAPIHLKDHTPSSLCLRRLKATSLLASAWLCLLLLSGQAWGQTDTEKKEGKGTIVAAGFGYQIGDVSTIAVKVYDAASGEVLSEEVYELNVIEENSARSNPSQERIFAGGVGLGATDLSNFVLRVYEAKTGKFQWEGQLNLTSPDGSGAGQMVSTVVPRRATITKIYATEIARWQPVFLLRALDASTGWLVWKDEFSADGTGTARVQQLATWLIGLDGNSTEASHTFDFSIRMFDRRRAVLWEDQFSQQEAEEDTHEAFDDQAHVLPAWPWQLQQGSTPEAI
jgi:hypothetical protein